MFFKKTPVTKEQLINAKSLAIAAAHYYKKTSEECYASSDAMGAEKVVELEIQDKKARAESRKYNKLYDGLWHRYQKENGL